MISSNSFVGSFKDINTGWVKGINGGKLYENLPMMDVNMFSPASILSQAYPGKFESLPDSFNLSQLKGVIHMKR